MADYERTVLDHYQLSTPYPTEWPAEKDFSDGGSDNEEETFAVAAANRKSRFAALERIPSDKRRSLVPGAQKTRDGVENLVQRDEPDPLGTSDSVVRVLRQQGLPVQEDAKLRNRFLLSSTTFSPAMFLSQVHSTASTQNLLEGLDVLSRSIDQKSASLKVLVESNFERFVRAKMTIDNVYNEMKKSGTEETQPTVGHSRHASRGSFRRSIGGTIPNTPVEGRRKNALTKETEYGVMGIRTPLIDVSAKAEEVWGPALGGREREESLKVLMMNLDRWRECYELPGSIADNIKRKDYEGLVEEYAKAKKFSDDAKRTIENGYNRKSPLSDREIHQILVVARMWYDVEAQIKEFEKDVWKRLSNVQGNVPNEQQDQHLELIGILLELGVEENPIWVWLLSRFEQLQSKIRFVSDRARGEIEVLRRRLANAGKPPPHKVASHLRSLKRLDSTERPTSMDSADIIELWERMHTFLVGLLSSQGALGEVIEFWQTVQGFIEGNTQKTLPVGFNGESKKHHALPADGVGQLKEGTAELVDMIREIVHAFFIEPPIEDISAIFSPIPPTPLTPRSASLTPSALRDPRFAFDSKNKPPPSPKNGDAWEKFAFWPPYSNSLSAVHYLAKLLVLVGDGASEMATISPLGDKDGGSLESLRGLVGGARERCITAICAAWTKDAENIKVLEDWKRSAEKKELTRMPANFGAFEGAILTGMQKIVYISEATKAQVADVILPPPTKLLQAVRGQFVTTLYKALSGMVENAEHSTPRTGDDWAMETDDLASPTIVPTTNGQAPDVNGVDRNVRMLLTLSNLQSLRVEIVPNLTTQFENFFSVKLTEESKTIRDVLGQIDARLFQSYTRPAVETLHRIISTGIAAPDWAPPSNVKPREVRPYVYEALLSLVLIHSQVSTTASSLTSQVLSYLLEQASRELLEAFKKRGHYTLSALMQATLDVEFVAQTLSQYTTDRAGELQGQIYQELDKGTDNDARTKLQSELPEMRTVLKRLRESSRSEFACFKKPRRRETQ